MTTQHLGGVTSSDYWDYQPNERVMTIDGFPGVVTQVEDGPIAGAENYLVTLDNGMGGGNYSASMLSKMPTSRAAAGVHLAVEDYPELGSILDDRPDPGKMTFTAASVAADDDGKGDETSPERQEADAEDHDEPGGNDTPSSCSYCGSTDFKDLTDNGRVRQATCATCNGTMSAHEGAQWTPELIGDPSNHPSPAVDPRSGASGAGGQAGINDFIDFDSRVSTTAAAEPEDDTATIPTRRVGFAGYVEGEKTNFANHGDNPDWEDEQAVGQHAGVHEFRGYSGRENDFAHWHDKGEITHVPLHGSTVYATQPRVTRRGLNMYLDNPEHKSGSGRPNYPANDRPIFVKHGGDYYTLDGHHRTAAAMQRGDKSVEGHVYDADKHGFPKAEWAPSQYNRLPKKLEKYSALAGAYLGCGFDTDDEDEALQHELAHHDDGFCSAPRHQKAARKHSDLPLLHPDDTHEERTAKLTHHYQYLSDDPGPEDEAYSEGRHPLAVHHQEHGVPKFEVNTHLAEGPDVKAPIAAQLSRHLVHMPAEKRPNVSISTPRYDGGLEDNTLAYFSPERNRIGVHRGLARSAEHDPKIDGTVATKGYLAKHASTPLKNHVLTHESGHALDFSKHEVPEDDENGGNKQRSHLLNKIAKAIPGVTPYKHGSSKYHWMLDNREHFINHVGPYAATSAPELIGELYAQHHHHPDPSEAARVVGRHLDGEPDDSRGAHEGEAGSSAGRAASEGADSGSGAGHREDRDPTGGAFRGRLTPEAAAMLRTAARDREFGFHITASWGDVQRKAKRIRAEGGVTIVIASNDGVGGRVKGDHGTYEALLVYRPGTHKVADWTCGCKWAAYAFERSPAFNRFEGRKCSHALALQFEAQSQGMFGKEVHPAEPTSREQAIVRYDPNSGEHVFARPYEGSLVSTLVARLRAEDADPGEVVGNLVRAGVRHRTAVLLWKGAEHHEDGERRCPHCGGFIGVEAVEHHRCPHCGAPLGGEGHERHEAAAAGQPLYRGIYLGMGDDHQTEALHGDPEARYRARAAGHERANLGIHWTPHFEIAKDFALNRNAEHEPMLFGEHNDHHHGVILESQVHPEHHVDRMSEEGHQLSREHGGIYLPDHREREVTVRPGSPVQVTHVHGVSLRDDGSDEQHSRVSSGSHYTAAAQDPPGPKVSGIALKAHDTGRVLMLQRGLDDEDDPAAGTWEFPGGHHEDGDRSSLHAGIREWEEEVGQEFPLHGAVKHVWTSPNGVYQGHVVVIPSEKDLSMKDGRVVPNPDDPKGDCHEQAAWWDPEHARKIPNLRDEVKANTPWKEIAKASLDATKTASAWDPISNTNPQPGRGTSEPAHSNTTNPASTGFAASDDPDNWNNLDANPEPLTPSLGFDAVLHDEPEPALPTTYGDEDATMRPAEMTQDDLDPVPDNPPAQMVPDQDANIHLLDGGSSLPNSYHASTPPVSQEVADVVTAFQRTAAGQELLAAASGPGDADIAAAARAHLAKEGAAKFDFAEQQELINEGSDGRKARNLGDLKIEGTHYELLEAALAHQDADPSDLFS